MESESLNSSSTKLDEEYSTNLIGAIDEGTTSTRFLVFSSKTFQVITHHQVKLHEFFVLTCVLIVFRDDLVIF